MALFESLTIAGLLLLVFLTIFVLLRQRDLHEVQQSLTGLGAMGPVWPPLL